MSFIYSGSGTQYPMLINPDGTLPVAISGNIVIGSVSAHVDSIYIQSGTMYQSSGTNYQVSGNTYIPSGTVYVVSGNALTGSMGLMGAGGIGPVEVDKSSHAVTMISHSHHELHDGKAFVVDVHASGGAGVTANICFTTADTSEWTHILPDVRSSVEAMFEIFEDGTYSGGTTFTATNRNRNSGIASTSTILTNCAISGATPSSGTLLIADHFGSGRIGGEDRGTHEWILKSGTTYLFVVTTEAASGQADLELNWYEHTDKTTQF